MPESSTLSEVLLALTRGVPVDYDVGAVLTDVADYVSTALGVRGATVCLATDHSVHHVASSCDVLASLAAEEQRTRRGPTVDAVQTGVPVLLSSLDGTSGMWPEYVAQAAAAGVGAIAAVPIREPRPVVTLTLSHDAPHEWTDGELRVTEMFAAMAGLLVRSGSELARLRRTAEQLQNALDSRVIIEQAKGFIADARGVSVDDAFVILRKYANDHHATLRSVADAVVNLGLRP